MNLVISSLFCEPGCFFSIPYKVDLLIAKKLNEMIIKLNGLDKVNPESTLCLIVSTNSKTFSVDVKGRILKRKAGYINWGIWLPYEKIIKTKNQLNPYIQYFFDAMVIFFSKFNVQESDVRKVQDVIERTVINNPEYIDSQPNINL
jgi:hypothetical protein